MKYDARACHFNMDTGCVELLLRDGRKISIDCTGVEDALNVTMAQRSELDYLIYNDPLAYADLILNGKCFWSMLLLGQKWPSHMWRMTKWTIG